MSFLSTHRGNILDRTTISKRLIEPGDIIEFRYKGKSGSGLKLVIVLNIFPMSGSFKVKKLHALTLSEISLPVFKRFLNRIGKPSLEEDERKNKKVVKLIIEGGQKGDMFYKRVASKFNKEKAYRTYSMDSMSSIKLIEYNFSNQILGIKDESLLQDTDT